MLSRTLREESREPVLSVWLSDVAILINDVTALALRKDRDEETMSG